MASGAHVASEAQIKNVGTVENLALRVICVFAIRQYRWEERESISTAEPINYNSCVADLRPAVVLLLCKLDQENKK